MLAVDDTFDFFAPLIKKSGLSGLSTDVFLESWKLLTERKRLRPHFKSFCRERRRKTLTSTWVFAKCKYFLRRCKECVNMAIQVCWLTMTKWVVTGERKHLANTSSCEKAPPQIPNWLDSRYRTMLASHSSHAGLWLFCNMPICLQICPGTKGNIEPKIFKREDETSRNCQYLLLILWFN